MKIRSIKFGGTSMGSSVSIAECADIVKEKSKTYRIIVTVSAVGDTTDQLLKIIALAKKQKPKLINIRILQLEKLHKKILSELVSNEIVVDQMWEQRFKPMFLKLRTIAQGTSLVGDLTSKTEARICAFGEKFSSYLMHAALDEAGIKSMYVESEKVVKTDSNYLKAQVNFQSTISACRKYIKPMILSNVIPIVTGFIGKDTHGNVTLLGRGGSDYTASILAMAFQAEAIEIWTDVDGIMSADPRIVKDPIFWKNVDINLMSEIVYSGAKVVYPYTIELAIKKNIPVYVFNTFNRKSCGTKITTKVTKDVKSIISKSENVLIVLEHPNIINHIGFLAKVTKIVERYNISIDVCSTSETSFSFSIAEEDFNQKMYNELKALAYIKSIKKVTKLCVIAKNIVQDKNFLASVFHLCAKNN
ncbi:MAG: aspartate kinase, partial [Alphaproteobacteria bacterium]|nr:aspartate kinase [Alphaproteobacteria bacterium]